MMKKLIGVALMLACSCSAFAQVKPLTDDEANNYLKPVNDAVYSNVVAVMVKNDAEASLQQNKTSDGFDLTPHSVKGLVAEFEKNEIVATDKYNIVATRIKGTIKSVGLDALKNGVITVSGDKPFSGNLIASVDKSADWVRKAGKGDKIDMLCNINGYVMLNVAAKCDSALRVTEQIVRNEYGITENYSLPKTSAGAAFAYTIKNNEVELGKACGKPDEKCFQKLNSIFEEAKANKPKNDPRLGLWVKQLPERIAQR